MASESPDEVRALIGFTVVSVLSTYVIKIFDKSTVTFDGFKRPKYVGSLIWQLLVLPACLALMMRGSAPTSFSELLDWARRGKQDIRPAPTYYFAALAGAQLKDFITGPLELWQSKKMFWHHVLVVLTCLYAERLQQGYGNFALSSLALEFGSAAFNLCSIFPGSRLFWYLYHGTITGSHVLALFGFFKMVWYDGLSVTVRALFGVSGIGVMIGRELVARSWRKKGFQYHLASIHEKKH
mmetsp:Transcript_107960/g.191185  ORF Transcript_107960/g.191185 Transcript_107960/m.191185 type:complete len:239 (-) Transcript_107960:36-752(-)